MENAAVNFVAGITNLVGNPLYPWLSCGIWWTFLETVSLSLRVIISQKFRPELTNLSSLYRVTCSLPQTRQSPWDGEQGKPLLTSGHRPTDCIILLVLILWSWFLCHNTDWFRFFQFLKDFVDVYGFLVWASKRQCRKSSLRRFFLPLLRSLQYFRSHASHY